TLLIYFFNDFSSAFDARIVQAYTNPQDGSTEIGRMIVNALKVERKDMFSSGIFRALLFAGLVIGLLYLYLKNIIKPLAAVIVFTIINLIDLLVVDSKYLNADHYMDRESYTAENFTPTAADTQILQDKDPHYRVYRLSGDRFSDAITAYFHRSVGGYHAAKLRI